MTYRLEGTRDTPDRSIEPPLTWVLRNRVIRGWIAAPARRRLIVSSFRIFLRPIRLDNNKIVFT